MQSLQSQVSSHSAELESVQSEFGLLEASLEAFNCQVQISRHVLSQRNLPMTNVSF